MVTFPQYLLSGCFRMKKYCNFRRVVFTDYNGEFSHAEKE